MKREDEFIRDLGLIGLLVSLIFNFVFFGMFSAWLMLVPESITGLAEYLKKYRKGRKNE